MSEFSTGPLEAPDQQQTEEPAALEYVLNAADQIARRLLDAETAVNQDEKSGLATETRWRKELDKTIESLSDHGTVVVMVGDLNGFKAVNDALGHQAGDELLGIVGEACKQTFRRSLDHLARGNRDASAQDLRGDLARLGGDEFAFLSVIKKNDDSDKYERNDSADSMIREQAARLNQAIRELTEGTKFQDFNISMAIGGAEFNPQVDKTPSDTFIRADTEMFKVKYEGKIDRITPDDREVLQRTIPYLESLGARVEDWLKTAVFSD